MRKKINVPFGPGVFLRASARKPRLGRKRCTFWPWHTNNYLGRTRAPIQALTSPGVLNVPPFTAALLSLFLEEKKRLVRELVVFQLATSANPRSLPTKILQKETAQECLHLSQS
jgi:hypothetical protein